MKQFYLNDYNKIKGTFTIEKIMDISGYKYAKKISVKALLLTYNSLRMRKEKLEEWKEC